MHYRVYSLSRVQIIVCWRYGAFELPRLWIIVDINHFAMSQCRYESSYT